MDFDKHCTSAARLAIIASLVHGGSLSFMELKRCTGLADGNLHVQTTKLTMDGYLDRRRESRSGRQRTYFTLTGKGLQALALHVRKLRVVLESGAPILGPGQGGQSGDDSRVW